MKLFSTRNINTLIAAIAGLVLLVFLLAYSETGTPPTFTSTSKAKQRPDFYLTNSHTRQYDEAGLLDFIMNSETLEHNPKADTVSLKMPYFQVFQAGQATWEIHALTGTVYDGGNKVDLEQRVEIINENKQSSLKTPQLFIYPNAKLANTDKPVTLRNNNGFTRAIGMKANLTSKNIALLDQVRGQYEPTAVPENAP
ncbi:LPS export ABC transporter periplasmic protein LptC [Oceanicoccus sagamiensis]|uniref:Lipopolysaccharide export system protein LptC n=1 Tax=Oceanicoccus sagamiensis TaxID=716816 RepID=A0A1X9NEK0_9GAMM|nr:LPS export ABC transporter periplasmic protein LptC [Oceanicoccus sagamiensis]ARN74862.1 LPS export ABC transporter periplasmic protein LptC [Oceanicoccus sagamiensis]